MAMRPTRLNAVPFAASPHPAKPGLSPPAKVAALAFVAVIGWAAAVGAATLMFRLI
jgi:hypothetical protein